MNKKRLQKKIGSLLYDLRQKLDQISEVYFDDNDPETWTSDELYDLAENLKEASQILENKTDDGLLNLIDDWEADEENEDGDEL